MRKEHLFQALGLAVPHLSAKEMSEKKEELWQTVGNVIQISRLMHTDLQQHALSVHLVLHAYYG